MSGSSDLRALHVTPVTFPVFMLNVSVQGKLEEKSGVRWEITRIG